MKGKKHLSLTASQLENLPAGCSAALCKSSPHFARLLDEDGKHLAFIPHPKTPERDFLAAARKFVYRAGRVGACSAASTRAVLNNRFSDDRSFVAVALCEITAYVQSMKTCGG
jgi:hypothetical protein